MIFTMKRASKYPYNFRKFTNVVNRSYQHFESEDYTQADKILNELKTHYPNILHPSIYRGTINNRQEKLIHIGHAILKTIQENPNFKKMILNIKIAVAPDEDYEEDFIYVVAYLNEDNLKEAAKAFKQLEHNILKLYPDKDIHILYSLLP